MSKRCQPIIASYSTVGSYHGCLAYAASAYDRWLSLPSRFLRANCRHGQCQVMSFLDVIAILSQPNHCRNIKWLELPLTETFLLQGGHLTAPDPDRPIPEQKIRQYSPQEQSSTHESMRIDVISTADMSTPIATRGLAAFLSTSSEGLRFVAVITC